ncbi:hypothetical protein [Ekhidna sp.]|uniref:hypothetical protein n=1 Tax=Ekhidna sp. TaxID=2608089 RepID=UPI003C7D63D0
MIESISQQLCDINWVELTIAIVASAIIGYFISIWASSNFEKKLAQRERDKLKMLHQDSAGNFENYQFEGKKIDQKVSDAVLEYIGDNKFKIIVTTYLDGNGNALEQLSIQKWKGRIWMEGIRNGYITYYGLQPDNLKGEFGFKRIIISSNRNNIVLFGEGGHGTEKFERVSER